MLTSAEETMVNEFFEDDKAKLRVSQIVFEVLQPLSTADAPEASNLALAKSGLTLIQTLCPRPSSLNQYSIHQAKILAVILPGSTSKLLAVIRNPQADLRIKEMSLKTWGLVVFGVFNRCVSKELNDLSIAQDNISNQYQGTPFMRRDNLRHTKLLCLVLGKFAELLSSQDYDPTVESCKEQMEQVVGILFAHTSLHSLNPEHVNILALLAINAQVQRLKDTCLGLIKEVLLEMEQDANATESVAEQVNETGFRSRKSDIIVKCFVYFVWTGSSCILRIVRRVEKAQGWAAK